MNSTLVVIAGAAAQKPSQAGHSWVFLQYLLGFKRLGWEVLFLDRLDSTMCADAAGKRCMVEWSENVRYLVDLMERFGLAGSFALKISDDRPFIGVPKAEVLRRVRASAFLLNVMGYINDEDILGSTRRRVFLDIDPGFGQMWRELGQADVFKGHDDFVTIGENIGQPGCSIPTCGLKWITTPQPIVLELWPRQPPKPEGAFSSIGAWRGPNAPIEYRGHTYGLRVHEFRKFVELPVRVNGTTEPVGWALPTDGDEGGQCPPYEKAVAPRKESGDELPHSKDTRFEMALDIHPADAKDIELLRSNGWSIVDPKRVAGGPEEYRAYVAGSKAEFMVAKNLYVQSNSGWFSDRSLCYLASGRPVLAQDTGIKQLYPTGEGLLTFSTLDEAAAGIAEINGNYARHCRAAREIAEEYFDSDKVLGKLLGDLGV